MNEMTTPPAARVASTSIVGRDAESLLRTARWARFIGIVGFVMVGLMVLFSLFVGSLLAKLFAFQQQMLSMAGDQAVQANLPMDMMGYLGGAYTALFLFSAVLYFFPSLYLYQFATRTMASLHGAFDAELFHHGLEAQRRLFTFMGILTIVLLAIYGLGFLMMLMGALFTTLI